jgi:hypothetical protein
MELPSESEEETDPWKARAQASFCCDSDMVAIA